MLSDPGQSQQMLHSDWSVFVRGRSLAKGELSPSSRAQHTRSIVTECVLLYCLYGTLHSKLCRNVRFVLTKSIMQQVNKLTASDWHLPVQQKADHHLQFSKRGESQTKIHSRSETSPISHENKCTIILKLIKKTPQINKFDSRLTLSSAAGGKERPAFEI